MSQCRLCGQEADVNVFGVCPACVEKMTAENIAQMNDPAVQIQEQEMRKILDEVLGSEPVGGLDQGLVASLKRLGRCCGAQKIVLFGSRARGDYRERSDVDLAVYGMSKENFSRFTSELEDWPTLLEFDVIPVSNSLDAAFLRNIEKEGVVVMEMEKRKLGHLIQAIERTKEGIAEYNRTPGKVLRDGVIQRFEFTAELAWKSCREYLIDQAYVGLNSPMSVMKTAYSAGLVDDEQGWVDLLKARNLTSHIYSDEQAEGVFGDIVTRFVPLFERLRDKLSAPQA